MVEKIRSVQNPLTVIAIFAALAEVAGTVALATVDKSLQHTFVWFVMAFPTCLVLLFFATLNFNPKVLYAPSDFKDEDNFLNTLAGGRAVSESFDYLDKQLEVAKRQILDETTEKLGVAADAELQRLANKVTEQLELFRNKLELSRESAVQATLAAGQSREVVRCQDCKLVQFLTESGVCRRCKRSLPSEDLASTTAEGLYPRSKLQAQILDYLVTQDMPVTLDQIAEAIGWGMTEIERAVKKLSVRGLTVITRGEDGLDRVQH